MVEYIKDMEHRITNKNIIDGLAELMLDKKADIVYSDPPWEELKEGIKHDYNYIMFNYNMDVVGYSHNKININEFK